VICSAVSSVDQRVFNITIESEVYNLVDIIALAGGPKKAVTLDASVVVDDGFVTISAGRVKLDPKINGIEIRRSLPHVAHAVSNGPYRAVDTNRDGVAIVYVDGSESHTHGVDLTLTQWIWKKGPQIIGRGQRSSFTLPVGTHSITLTVIDSGGNQATEATTVTVYPFGYPDIAAITPSAGSILGGERVFIVGTGFNYSSSKTIVYFGIDRLTGSAIQVVNSTTISVLSPQIPISVPVSVSVQTPLGQSETKTFNYISSSPIVFRPIKLLDFEQPTSAVFGPDGKLYVSSYKGTLAKITMNADFTSVTSMVTSIVQPNRAILGITFDPMDAGNLNPPVYISSSLLFHKGILSSSGTSINGKISRISGANLDIIEDIITGLPVCDVDHGMCKAITKNSFGMEKSNDLVFRQL
jgi:hypothetical protein